MSDWEPSDVDIEWTEAVLESLEPGKSWVEGEMTFLCTGDKELTLISRTERASAPAERVGVVLEHLGWTYDPSHVNIIPDDPLEAMQSMQETAQGWVCPHCEEDHIVNCDLEKAIWVNDGSHTAFTEDGLEDFPRWVVRFPCIRCEEEITVSPMDFSLLAGEEAFYSWTTPSGDKAHALDRQTLINMADLDDYGETSIIGTEWEGFPVPPHMQGTYCSITRSEEEE